jgi:hypothetical protein
MMATQHINIKLNTKELNESIAKIQKKIDAHKKKMYDINTIDIDYIDVTNERKLLK